MQIDYEGQSYTYDLDDIDLLQAMAIEAHTGIRFSLWTQQIAEGGHLIALQALGWLLLTGGDLKKPIKDTNFKLNKMGDAFAKANAQDAADAGEAEPDPTPPAPDPEENGAVTLSAASSTAGS